MAKEKKAKAERRPKQTFIDGTEPNSGVDPKVVKLAEKYTGLLYDRMETQRQEEESKITLIDLMKETKCVYVEVDGKEVRLSTKDKLSCKRKKDPA